MYISSDGTEKDPKYMNTEYIINALSKCLKEIYNSKSLEEYNKYMYNIQYLDLELSKRMDEFLTKMIESEWK